MPRRAITLVLALLTSLVLGATFAQQQVRITGVHVDELGELPVDMRVGVFAADRGQVSDDEITSVRMVAGTFDLEIAAAPDERRLRPLISGSFPLAFMIGNEFIADRDGVRFATAVVHPYQDSCGTEAFDARYDVRFGTTIPELPDFGGFFNLVYVSDPIVLRATAAEFVLQRGWNLVISRFEAGRLVYSVGRELDIVIVTTGANIGAGDRLPCP